MVNTSFKHLVTSVLLLFMASVASPLFAQNLLTNGEFETNGGYLTDYERTYSAHVVEGGHYAIDNTTANHGGGSGWPQPANSSGRFMLVNGFGGNVNPTKRVWYTQFPIAVTPNTTYVFSCKVANLNLVINGQVNPAKLQLKMNDAVVGSPNQLPADNNWHEWSVTWYNESATEVVPAIYDLYTGNTSLGDDYALDFMSLVANETYTVAANNDDNISVCQDVAVDIDVLGNDVILPNTTGAVVTVVTNPSHGTCSVLTDNRIRYTFTGGNYSSDQIRYRVTTHGVSSEAWVYITTNRPPTISNIATPSTICAGSSLGIAVPSMSPSGTGGWQRCQTSNGTNWTSFDPNNIPISMNGWWVRYSATNECGTGSSNAVQITVSQAPVIASPTTPAAICAGENFVLATPSIQSNGSTVTNQGWQILVNGSWQTLNNYNIPYEYNGCQIRYFAENECAMTYSATAQVTVNDEPLVGAITAPAGICAGGSFNLIAPQVTWRHVNQGTGSWEIQVNGQWQTLNNNNIPLSYNGCSIRYKAVNGCGTAYSTNTVQVTVYSTEPIDEGDITACDVIYHHGLLCDHNGDYTFDSITPNNCTIEVSWHFTLGEAYVAPVQYQEACNSYYWPKTHQTYYESNVYEVLVESDNPQVCDSTFTLDLTINQAPEILSDLQAPVNVCAGNALNVLAPQFQMNHSGGGSQRWEYATSANGPFTTFDPLTSNLSYGTYYIRFVVTNACGEVNSNVVSFHVDDAPVANVELSAMQVCEGQALDLPTVNVTWNNTVEDDRTAQWQMSSSQNSGYTAISPTMPMQASYNGNWLRFVAHNSCGDDIIGPVMITVIEEAEDWLETIHSCDSYTLESGAVITESQVVDYEYYEPCYHVVHQPVEISNSDEVTERITSCQESYVWNGMTFNHSSNTQYATLTLSNAAGCDSIVNLELDFGAYATYTHDRIGCNSYVWEMKPDYTYTSSTTDSVFVAAVYEDDCDTWYYLNLTLGHDVVVDGGDMMECSGFVWHGVPYYSDAVVYDSLLTPITHCDSIVAYQLHIIEPVATDTSIVACNPIWWQEHYCEEEGEYQHTFQSVYGCDSVVTVHFSFSEQLYYEFDSLSCEPFQWFEYQCNTNGMTCSHLFQTAQGCDSTVVMHVHLSEPIVATQIIQACDSYEFEGVVYDEPGVIYFNLDTLQTQLGCDSVVQIRLEIRDSETIGLIHGSSNVYVSSNLVSGVYRYDIDRDGLTGDVAWSLANPQWQFLETADDHCVIVVTTPGVNTLKARFDAAECGEIERTFEITAGYFGVEELANQAVQVYPNPTKGTVRIEAEGIETLRLVDRLGQLLEVVDCHRSDSYDLNLSAYAPSVYLIEIKTVNGVAKKRVVLCR